MRQGFIDQLLIEANKNSSIYLLTADLGYSFLESFQSSFPDRFINVGVAEQNLISCAAGLALEGKKVFVYSIINFLTFRALDQIRLDICYHDLDVTLVGVGADFSYTAAGYSHYALEDITILSPLPNIEIYSPADRWQTQLVVESICKKSKPVYLRLGKNDQETFCFDSGNITKGFVCNLGSQGVIITYGQIASKILKMNYPYKVITLPLLKPLDEFSLLEHLRDHQRVIVIEEHKRGALSSQIALILHQYKLKIEADFFFLDDDVVSEENKIDLDFLSQRIL